MKNTCLCFVLIVFCISLMVPFVSAIQINPSVDSQPFYCKNSITGWICDSSKPGIQGDRGLPGRNGTDNFSAMYFNAYNFSSRQNISNFYNSSNLTSFSNFTSFYGATVYNVSGLINDSYYNKNGWDYGQLMYGGTTATGYVIISGSSDLTFESEVRIQPYGGKIQLFAPPIYRNWSSIYNTIQMPDTAIAAGPTYLPQGLFFTQNVYHRADAWKRIRSIPSSMMYLYNGYFEFRTAPTGSADNTISWTIPLHIENNGNVGMGTDSPTSQLTTTGTVRFMNFGAGTATFDAGGNLSSVSDEKFKTNIKSIDYKDSISKIKQLNPVSYNFKVSSGLDSTNTYTGFLAGEVERVLPDAVKTKKDVKIVSSKAESGDISEKGKDIEIPLGTVTKSLDDRAIIVLLTNGIKEQEEKIEAQQKEIDALTERITKLEAIK